MNRLLIGLAQVSLLLALSAPSFAQPTVTMLPADGTADEAGPDGGGFRVLRTDDGNTMATLNVQFAVTGTATINGDYTLETVNFHGNPNIYNVTIPANDLSVTVSLTPLQDNAVEGTESAIFTLVESGTNAYFVGADTSTQIDIADDVAVITISLNDGDASEAGPDPGSFTIHRSNNGKVSAVLGVQFSFTGTGTPNGDYMVTPVSFHGNPNIYNVNIPANELSIDLTLTPVQDNAVEGTESAIFTLVGSSANSYVLGVDTMVQVDISDDVAMITISLNDGDASEAGPDPGSFTVHRSNNGKVSAVLGVQFSFTGTGTPNGDYTVTPVSFHGNPNIYNVNIPANELSIDLTLTPIQDNAVEGPESAIFTLVGSSANSYVLGVDTMVQVDISDDVAMITISLNDGDASEAGPDPGSFTVHRSNNGKVSAVLGVQFAITGTATLNGDYSLETVSFHGNPNIYNVNIPASQLSVEITLTPIFDMNEEGDESAEFNLVVSTANSYVLGADTQAIITIADFLEMIFRDSFETL